jgi:hypothetical protein
MARTIGLHLTDGNRAVGSGRESALRDVLAGTVLLAAWLAVWAFLMVGVAGPLGSIQRAAPPAAVHERT